MAPSWSTCDPLSCFSSPPPSPSPHSSWPLILRSECAASRIAALPYRDAESDNGPGYKSQSQSQLHWEFPDLSYGSVFGFGFSFGFL